MSEQLNKSFNPEYLKSLITDKYYFTAGDGVHGDNVAKGETRSVYDSSLDQVVFCVLVLKGGFTIVGQSNGIIGDKELSKAAAFGDAFSQIQKLENYKFLAELGE